MKDRKKPEKFLPPHGMPSDGCEFAFSSRVSPKALTIKIPYTSWNYQSVDLYGWRGVLYPGYPGDLSCSRAPGSGRTTTAASVAACLERASPQALRTAAGGRDGTPLDRWDTGTRGDAPTPGARRGGHQYGLYGAAERDVPGAPRSAGTPLPSAGAPHADTAAW